MEIFDKDELYNSRLNDFWRRALIVVIDTSETVVERLVEKLKTLQLKSSVGKDIHIRFIVIFERNN